MATPTTRSDLETPPLACSAEAPLTHEADEPRDVATAGRSWLPLLAGALLLASLLGPIAASGIWDPFELRVAELARRIALNLLGAKNLAIEGSHNGVPTLGELGRGQLPFTSIALGFKLFGLHEWGGRLPLAVWGIAGAAASYALVSRLVDRIAASFTVIALATMPLYFLHSRTMLGDVVTMASMAIAVSGLTLALVDRRPTPRVRVGWLVLGLVGLAAGFGSRGALIGLGAPALGVGLGWALVRMRPPPSKDAFGDVLGVSVLALGFAAAAVGLRAVLRAGATPGQYSMWLGAAVETQRAFPTYDAVIHYLGHGLFPWSAFVPLAIGRLLSPPQGVRGPDAEREIALRMILLITSATALGAVTTLAPTVGVLPYSGVGLLAAIAGIALRDLDRGAPGSRTLGAVTIALGVLFYYDFKTYPEKGFSAYVVTDPRFPDSFKETAHTFLKLGMLAFMGPFFAAVMERTDPNAPRFERDEYLAWPRALRSELAGNLWFGFLVAEAALAGYALLSWLSRVHFHWKQFQSLTGWARDAATFGWLVLPIVVLALPPLVLAARDISRVFFLKVPISRGTVATCSVAVFGALLSFGYYPKLAAQLSPKDVFDSYRKHAKPGEALGIVGVGRGTATYYAGRDVPTFDNPNSAFQWLSEERERRWLVVKASDLPQLNSLFRGLSNRNVPVLDARSSEILLLSNRLVDGETNENPLGKWVLDSPPAPTRQLDVNLGGQLDVLGWDVTDQQGRPLDAVVPGKKYDFRIYYKVVASISGNWETFIHIDGYQRRFNGDHQTLENKYAFHLWRVGDIIADIYPFSLEPNFTPGDYEVYFGLFIGNRRLEVKRGRHNDNRVEAGRLRVR